MKIHDKFVIELAEVIKGFGNDYRVNEPANLPCDYKFYEIGGVAICEESVKKMKPLNEEINTVLDEIRAEIEKLYNEIDTTWLNEYEKAVEEGKERAYEKVLDIIDEHKESEGKE